MSVSHLFAKDGEWSPHCPATILDSQLRGLFKGGHKESAVYPSHEQEFQETAKTAKKAKELK